jgi:hypothetical protein
MKLVYKDGTPMRKVRIKALEELYKPIFSINNKWFYFDIIKAEDRGLLQDRQRRGPRAGSTRGRDHCTVCRLFTACAGAHSHCTQATSPPLI